MHDKPMADSEGVFDGWKPTVADNPDYSCRKCSSKDVYYRTWDSSCGGYTDYQYHCRGCDRKWWVEGADA